MLFFWYGFLGGMEYGIEFDSGDNGGGLLGYETGVAV